MVNKQFTDEDIKQFMEEHKDLLDSLANDIKCPCCNQIVSGPFYSLGKQYNWAEGCKNCMEYSNRYAVFIGRFQPLHNGHLNVINHGLSIAHKLIVVLGSCYSPRTIKNPWTDEERIDMFRSVLSKEKFDKIKFIKVRDYHYNDNKWLTELKNKVNEAIPTDAKVTLIGYDKDDTTYYLSLFKNWENNLLKEQEVINATDIRNAYFDMGRVMGLPWAISEFLSTFRTTFHYKHLRDEWVYVKACKDSWANAPFPPVFVTVDAIVEHNGHILVIKRKNSPGKGLYALPGGFLNKDERIFDGALRELKEETGLVVNKSHLQRNDYFDYPSRSLRGRTITHGFHFKIDSDELQKVDGGDDAASATWLPIPDVYKNEDSFFEDHFSIICYFLEKGNK